MKVTIIGGGFTGLSAAYYLQKQGHETTVFERAQYLGGLAGGVRNALDTPPDNWEWDLEQFYHHWFTNDDSVYTLGSDIGVTDKFITKRPRTDILYNDNIYALDSPLALLRFPHLSVKNRILTGVTIAKLKYWYDMDKSKEFESIRAVSYLQEHSSKEAYEKIWKPLLIGKFKEMYDQVNMRWFWARIYKRTPGLVYYNGGFSAFIEDIATAIKTSGGRIVTGTPVEIVKRCDECRGFHVSFSKDNFTHDEKFDKVIVTTPPHILPYMYPDLPDDYKESLKQHDGIGALVLILRLRHPIMRDTYWLSVNNTKWPFLALVEHTNFMPKEKYGDEHIVYVGNYLRKVDPYMNMSKSDLIHEFTPYIKRINPLFSEGSIIDSILFKTNYAQPVPKLNHEQNILPFETPIDGLYLATMAQVYPWDRGTNYAIEMGKNVAERIS